MGILKSTLFSADITILGHFNPAILRHDFLTQVCKIDQGNPVNSSPPEVFVVSEIQYNEIRWFMDFDRMTVQNFKLVDASGFTAPRFAERYLRELPYTPIFASGFNVIADFELSDSAALWNNLLRSDTIYSVISGLGGEKVETVSRVGLSASGGELIESTIIYDSRLEGRSQLTITRLGTKEVIRGALNFEIREIEDRDKFSLFISRARDVLTDFTGLMTVFSERI